MSWFKRRTAEAKQPPADSGPASMEGSIRISNILAPGAIKIAMEATEKEEAFEELVDLLVQTGGVTDREAALAALNKREEMGSTGIGNGVAIPHAKDATIPRLVAALGISPDGVEFNCMDGKPANVIFMLLAREDNPGPHIQALAAIAQLIQSSEFIRRLSAAKTPADVLDVIRSEE